MLLPVSQSRIKVILDGLYFDTRTQRGKGTAFERLVRQFLLTDPRYAERFDEVWMWSEWPERGARPDRGIDLVARERETGELCAVQCKFYDPATGVITKGDVDSFLAESGTGEFTSRLFVSTTEHWNSAAEETVSRQAIPVSRIGLEDLFNSTIDWDSFSLETPEVMVRTGGKSLREHQKRALDAVTAGLSTADRGKLIMACGTGKTFTSLRIAEAMAGSGGRVLFLVPSIALLSQTLMEWSAESEVPLRSFAVCSDTKIGNRQGAQAHQPEGGHLGGGPGDPSHHGRHGTRRPPGTPSGPGPRDGPDDGGLLHLPVDRRRRPGPKARRPRLRPGDLRRGPSHDRRHRCGHG